MHIVSSAHALLLPNRRKEQKLLHVLEVSCVEPSKEKCREPNKDEYGRDVHVAREPSKDEWSRDVHVVKEYVRAGAGHLVPDPCDLRPPNILIRAIHYLLVE